MTMGASLGQQINKFKKKLHCSGLDICVAPFTYTFQYLAHVYTNIDSLRNFYNSQILSGCSHVYHNCCNFCDLLAAVPPLLYIRLPQSGSEHKGPRPAHLLGLLLAGNVQRDGQSDNLLLDEWTVN